MTIREQQEALEHEILSPRATFADETRGRERPEEECPMRTPFQRDRDRILHCNAFRRLTHKTQVFLSPEGDHYRTRLTHTLEVSQIARTLSRALRLNEDLTEAIALGHDLGHTPFGHAGEYALQDVYDPNFHHAAQSVRVVTLLEREGRTALRRRPESGLLAGLWEYPHVPGALTEAEAARQLQMWGVSPTKWTKKLSARHIFTHVRWEMTGYVGEVDGLGPGDWLWAEAQQRERLAIPSAFEKFTAELKEGE